MRLANKIPVSVYLITLNEADNLRRLLNQLLAFQEVIIVDCGSTDQTRDVASKFGNVQLFHRDWTTFSEQKAYALSLCRNEWVLNLDADEELTTGFIDELQATVQDNRYAALECRRLAYRWGRRSNYLSKDNRLIRLFRKQHGHYVPRRVHERISITGLVRQTSAHIIHHQNMTFDEAVQKLNRYSQLKAMDKYEAGDRSNLILLFFIFPVSFLQYYVFKGFFLGGCDGFLGSMNFAYYNFMKYAKLWELEHLKEAEIKYLRPAVQAGPKLEH